ncbi:hypothetical protein PV755_46450 [Streptomyces caniscabiei]|uniref:hypothetical protein n=1 Tax=Streptomyces caniscabiei TaxID=2746961 RepID=UPI0029BF96EF|nr:hypothetical protein [Streptomyces caniscabiei]MDX3516246.1 hypothetical protein [Streptomyces caniscabiei]MDX3725257.1 hypothetical protein [Streptomyces caniscabiei]
MTERDTTAQAGLTADRLDEIDARHSAATPGPWGVYEFGGGTAIDIAAALTDTGTGYRARREICRLEDEPLDNDPTHREWTAEEDWAQVQSDAVFVAHAREDVPALLAEIRRLHGPTESSRYLEDGSTHTVQALTDAGESCVQQECTAAREEARLRQEQYSLRTEVENVLDEVGHMADDERLTADAAGELRRLLRSALGLDRHLT